MRYSNNYEDAEDLLSDVFIKIFSQIKKFKFKGSFEGWIKRITINSALNKIKSDKKRLYLSLDYFSSDLFEDNSGDVIDFLSANELLELIHDLSPKYRAVFSLYVIEGYSHKEIAKALEISVGTSKSNLHDAKLILQKKIKRIERVSLTAEKGLLTISNH